MKKSQRSKEIKKHVGAKLRPGLLILELPLEKPKLSASGKTSVIASTHGFIPIGLSISGSEIYVAANACIYAANSAKGNLSNFAKPANNRSTKPVKPVARVA